MKQAKDFIIFPLDVDTTDAAREWVVRLADHVGRFKIGLELFIRGGPSLVRWIVDNTPAGVFLDLKLHDIPVTVQRAMQALVELNVDLTTVHCGDSRSMLEAAVRGSAGRVNVLGVTVLTSVSAEDLRSAGYDRTLADDPVQLVLHKAAMAKDAGCAGVVCSGREVKRIKARFGKDFIAVTPGIRPDWRLNKADDQRRIVTPAVAVADGADFLVIGRPIRNASDPVEAVQRITTEIDAALENKAP